jgi:hypothetical protein
MNYWLPRSRSSNRANTEFFTRKLTNSSSGNRKISLSNKMNDHVLFRVAIEFCP